MYSAAGKSHSSRCLMVSTAVMTLFRAKLSATTVAATIQPVLNVVFCAKASKGDKSGILWGVREASNPTHQPEASFHEIRLHSFDSTATCTATPTRTSGKYDTRETVMGLARHKKNSSKQQ